MGDMGVLSRLGNGSHLMANHGWRDSPKDAQNLLNKGVTLRSDRAEVVASDGAWGMIRWGLTLAEVANLMFRADA